MRGGRTLRPSAAGALLIAVLGPTAAEAQLFPNLPARKRERADCAQELPVYGLYRNKYYGYFPTCWRTFPPGWGCPSPEAPDWEAELARAPLDIPEEDGLGLDGEDPMGGSGLDDLLPELPSSRSPFEMDRPGDGAGAGGAADPFERPGNANTPAPSPFGADPFAPPGRSTPGEAAPADPPARSPFDLPGPGASATPGEVPSVAPPVTEAHPVAPATASVPELAVMPDLRPRPVSLPSSAAPPSTRPAVAIGPISGPASAPVPAGLPTSVSGLPPGAFPGEVVTHGPDGVIISDPSLTPGPVGDPAILYGEGEPRPRRRFLSGLFGRGH